MNVDYAKEIVVEYQRERAIEATADEYDADAGHINVSEVVARLEKLGEYEAAALIICMMAELPRLHQPWEGA